MRFRVAQKGLILVLVPLAFEVGLFFWMQGLLKESEVTAERARHSREVIGTVNLLAADFLEIYRTFDVSSPLNFNNEKIKENVQLMHSDLEHLKHLARNSSESNEWLVGIEKEVNETLAVYDEAWKLYSNKEYGALWDRVPKYREFFKNTLGQNSARMLSFTSQQKQIADEEPEQQAQFRTRTKSILGIWLAMSGLVSVLLVIFFSRQIARRLQTITENNERLTAGKPLNPPVSGTDEIRDLDVAFHNMSAELAASRERDRATQQLRDQVVAMITHDLRTPLDSISMYVEFMADEPVTDQAKDLQTLAERNINRMRRLINDFLDLERLQAGSMPLEKAPFNLSHAIEHAVSSVTSGAMQKHVSITSSGDCTVWADEHRIVQVLTNLLANAIKFSPAGSSVNIGVSAEGETATVAVSDTGRGIAPDAMNKIFDAFQQTKQSDVTKLGGSGLGLSICKALVEQHGGTITVTSTEGQGSTFTFTLPTSGPADEA